MNKKAILLFEVLIVAILVSIASTFLFRGYSVFMKAARKSLGYLELVYLSQNKVWDLYRGEKEGGLDEDKIKNVSSEPGLNWQINVDDTDYKGIKKVSLILTENNNGLKFDRIIYLKVQGQ